MSYVYSAKNNAFYPIKLKDRYENSGIWPADGVEVGEDVFSIYAQLPPVGKMRIAGPDGWPAWGDIPPPTPEQLIIQTTAKKSSLMAEASAIIAPLADAQAGGYIDDADILRLIAYQKYRYALTKVDPAKPLWPEPPF